MQASKQRFGCALKTAAKLHMKVIIFQATATAEDSYKIRTRLRFISIYLLDSAFMAGSNVGRKL